MLFRSRPRLAPVLQPWLPGLWGPGGGGVRSQEQTTQGGRGASQNAHSSPDLVLTTLGLACLWGWGTHSLPGLCSHEVSQLMMGGEGDRWGFWGSRERHGLHPPPQAHLLLGSGSLPFASSKCSIHLGVLSVHLTLPVCLRVYLSLSLFSPCVCVFVFLQIGRASCSERV